MWWSIDQHLWNHLQMKDIIFYLVIMCLQDLKDL